MKKAYEVIVTGVSEKKFIVAAENAEQAGRFAEAIYKNSNIIAFDDFDVDMVEVEAIPIDNSDEYYGNAVSRKGEVYGTNEQGPSECEQCPVKDKCEEYKNLQDEE